VTLPNQEGLENSSSKVFARAFSFVLNSGLKLLKELDVD
jgi:hypothetical protein